MNADSFFTIGASHQVCQDYAIANGDFVILSDGCSSAKDSDWGARLLSVAAFNILKNTKPLPSDIERFSQNVLDRATHYIEQLELHEDCLAATLLCAYVIDGTIVTSIIGDGHIVVRNKVNKELTSISHTFDTGAPYYLYYNLKDYKETYFKHFGEGNLIIDITAGDINKVTSTDVKKAKFANCYTFPADQYDLVAISSDGLKSFVKQSKNCTSITNKTVEVDTVIGNLFKFKSLEGQFVHRRCQRFLKDCAGEGIRHNDDFSLGVLHL